MSIKKNGRQTRYMIIRKGTAEVRYTDDFIGMMKNEYRYFFDTTDYLFDRYPDIRVFVKEESLFTQKPTVYYCQDSEPLTTFNGTVFFAKLGITKVRSLSKKEISFLLRNLNRRDDDTFEISYEAS